jgi:hypothetical protein
LFSRHLGIIRWFFDGQALADVICDTTDIAREDPQHHAVLATVMFSANHASQCRKYLPDVVVV